MAMYIALIDYTEKGLQTITDSPARSDAFRERAEKAGVTVKELYWTSGAHDGVLIFGAPDDMTASALLLNLSRTGNVRTQTLRAYGRAEMEQILAKVE